MLETLAADGHPPPVFADNGIRFTVLVRQSDGPAPATSSRGARRTSGGVGHTFIADAATTRRWQRPTGPGGRPLNDSETTVWRALAVGETDVATLAVLTSMQPPTIRKALRTLRAEGFVEQRGGRGQSTTYLRTRPGD